ncbi:sentrin-specific protease 5-like [Embiotoca jacksoni]|uniref:sentrin-specific protease 5-like n=1 Tax=Embiotoca jacksoni TaxID=100190 RepID=UPI0037048D90
MHRTQNNHRKTKCSKGRKGFKTSIKGVSHLSRRAKRRLYCKLQLWMWRKRREKSRFGIFRAKNQGGKISSGLSPCLDLKTQTQSQQRKSESPMYHTLNGENSQVEQSALVTPPGWQNCLPEPSESDARSDMLIGSTCFQNQVTDTDVAAGTQETETLVQFSESTDPLRLCHSVRLLQSTDGNECEGMTPFEVPRTIAPQRLEVDGPSEQHATITAGQDQTTDRVTDEIIIREKTSCSQTEVCLEALIKDIHEFLDDFYQIYGSFIPLHKSDVLKHLKGKFNTDFSDWKNIFAEVSRYRIEVVQKPAPSFRVVYKKHTLTLDDLLTLADQNWLNDQVMNMYGELIVESSHDKVHFLNSFFHRQLMTKGYDGVKRWTKQVDLFSKSLLLVPIHLEVHWCLVTADIVKKKICLYDSQGNALQKVARNILKYLMSEAKEKQQPAFENGWTVSFDEKIPQQTNENDCGVFVLEYSKCLALRRPLQFSQNDIPKIRKRIYKELCDCKLYEQD